MTKYEQLDLNGSGGDYYNVITSLPQYRELIKMLNTFYIVNKNINPRQLHYIVCYESGDVQLDALLELL